MKTINWYKVGKSLQLAGLLLFYAGIPLMIVGGLLMLLDNKNKPIL